LDQEARLLFKFPKTCPFCGGSLLWLRFDDILSSISCCPDCALELQFVERCEDRLSIVVTKMDADVIGVRFAERAQAFGVLPASAS
jgi:hypothetical protein